MKECPRCLACFDDNHELCPNEGHPLEASLPGSKLIDDKYEIERLLGKGGMGAVYLVQHLGLQKRFALKLIRPSEIIRESFLTEFQTEARLLGRLKHDNIVEVTDYGTDAARGNTPYLVMEYLEGTTLTKRMSDSGPLSLDVALPILDQLAEAIDHAHRLGILHCDIKPANVFLYRAADHREIVKIVDFGLAMLLRAPTSDCNNSISFPSFDKTRASRSGTDQANSTDSTESATAELSRTEFDGAPPLGRRIQVRGTLGYMAPEILRGEQPTPAADIYSLGVLIYELIAGRLPFEGTTHNIVHGKMNLQAPRPSSFGIPTADDVEDALLCPLALTPHARPKTAHDAVKAIRSAHFLAERKSWRARELPRRFGLSLMLALILTLVSMPAIGTTPLARLQSWTLDTRFLLAPRKPPDRQILIICVDDATLAADQTLLGDRGDEFGRQLDRVFAAGAKRIAIDFLLPRSWSRSATFSQFVLRHAPNVTLAAFSTAERNTVGTECLSGLTAAALGPERLGSLFGYVNLDEDWDGVTRHARFFYPGQSGEKLYTWAAHVAGIMNGSITYLQPRDPGPDIFWIDYSIDWMRFDRISWMDLSRLLEANPSMFEGRLILVGGDFSASGDDFHRIPGSTGSQPAVSGVILEAMMVNTILSGIPFRDVKTAYTYLASFVACVILLSAALCLHRILWVLCTFCGLGLHGVLITALLFKWAGVIFPIVGLVAATILALASGLVLRTRLAPFPIQDLPT